MLAGYDFVAFDFDGTLVDFVSADALALEAVRQQHAPLIDAQKFRQSAIEEIIHFHEEVAIGIAVGADMHRTRLERTLRGSASPRRIPSTATGPTSSTPPCPWQGRTNSSDNYARAAFR